ncbi:MAG: hypothetical protein PVSMB5_25560 [Ktedonobacteraceae bacterium]
MPDEYASRGPQQPEYAKEEQEDRPQPQAQWARGQRRKCPVDIICHLSGSLFLTLAQLRNL